MFVYVDLGIHGSAAASPDVSDNDGPDGDTIIFGIHFGAVHADRIILLAILLFFIHNVDIIARFKGDDLCVIFEEVNVSKA